eukprot:5420781-Lingulodinium_polyedra.AAC.1
MHAVLKPLWHSKGDAVVVQENEKQAERVLDLVEGDKLPPQLAGDVGRIRALLKPVEDINVLKGQLEEADA